MMSRRYCSVPQCKSYKNKEISIHKFPSDPILRKKWQTTLKINKEISKYMSVCSLHFEQNDFHPDPLNMKKRFLKKGIIPSKKIPVTSIEKKSPIKRKKVDSASRKTSQPAEICEELSADPLGNLNCLAEVCESRNEMNVDVMNIEEVIIKEEPHEELVLDDKLESLLHEIKKENDAEDRYNKIEDIKEELIQISNNSSSFTPENENIGKQDYKY